jgi:hypothetical protein
MSDDLESVADLEVSSAGLAIDTFALVLLPLGRRRMTNGSPDRSRPHHHTSGDGFEQTQAGSVWHRIRIEHLPRQRAAARG